MLLDELTRRFPELTKLGNGCYVVGGAIRDLLLEREPADVDVACPDPLTAAQRIRQRVIRLGTEEHLSAYRVVVAAGAYDFAEILDGEIEADLARRDFTINAMAVDLETGDLLDPHDGRRDIERRILRMIRTSNFDDDPLRTLKAVRMAVAFDLEVEAETLAAIVERAERIREVAAERVTYELSIIFSSNAFRRAVALLRETRLDQALGLRTGEFKADDVSLAGSYALLVDDIRAFATRWRWSVALTREVETLQRLIDHHDRIALYDAGESIARQLPGVLRALRRDTSLDWPDFSTRSLLTGKEIAEVTDVAPGKELGRIKRALLEAQIRGDVASREEAERLVTAEARSAQLSS